MTSHAPDERSALYRALFETAPDAMVVVGLDGRIVLANPQAALLFGYAVDELLGQPVEIMLPEHVRDAHLAHKARYMERPRVRPMGAGQELVGRRRDGTHFPVEIALSPVSDAGATLFAASIRDISETQRQRQALARSRYDAFTAKIGQLALEAPDFDHLAEKVAPLVVEALDADGAGIFVLQPQRGEILSCAARSVDSDVVAAACRSIDLSAVAGAGAGAEAHPLDSFVPASIRSDFAAAGVEGGCFVPILNMANPMGALVVLTRRRRVFDRDAEHFLKVVANVLATAALRHQTQDQLAHAQRLDAVGQLTGGIAHDFNNLLTIVSGNLQILEDELVDNPDASDVIARALRAVGRGAELTRKLLAFARRQRLSPAAIDTRKLLDELGVMLKRTLGETIRVEVDCGEAGKALPPVFADPSQLEGALLNLALNARDAMPRGGRLELTARALDVDAGAATSELPAGNYIVVSVADSGLGMSPDVLARAFEPFFTTKEAGKGSGLGLSMVYGFVKQSGGHLLAQSQLGYGTLIELYLPVASTGAPGIVNAPAATPRRGKEAILVVEDEFEVRGIAVAFLRSLGYSVHEASDAAQALAVLRDEPEIALLFSDVVLGNGQTGIELAYAARSVRPDLPVLLTSGYDGLDSDLPRGVPLVRKPYRKEDLAGAVRDVLDRAP